MISDSIRKLNCAFIAKIIIPNIDILKILKDGLIERSRNLLKRIWRHLIIVKVKLHELLVVF